MRNMLLFISLMQCVFYLCLLVKQTRLYIRYTQFESNSKSIPWFSWHIKTKKKHPCQDTGQQVWHTPSSPWMPPLYQTYSQLWPGKADGEKMETRHPFSPQG